MAQFEYQLMSLWTEPGAVAGFGLRDPDIAGWLDRVNAAGRDGWEAVGEVALRMSGSTNQYPQLLLKRAVER